MARLRTAPSGTGFVVACSIAAGTAISAGGGCSSPSRAPESDVIEVERIDLTAPEGASGKATEEETLLLPGATPARSPNDTAPADPAPTETVPAPEAK